MDQHNNERIRVVYFERADGYVYVPGDSSRQTPRGYERHEATTLREIDKLTQKLNRQDKRDFDAMFEQDLAIMKANHDRHRDSLRRRMLAIDCSSEEQLFIKSALRYFDRKESECLHYTINGYFQQREYDQSHKKVDDYGKQLVMPKMSARLSSILTG